MEPNNIEKQLQWFVDNLSGMTSPVNVALTIWDDSGTTTLVPRRGDD